jgi:hypothetical protein
LVFIPKFDKTKDFSFFCTGIKWTLLSKSDNFSFHKQFIFVLSIWYTYFKTDSVTSLTIFPGALHKIDWTYKIWYCMSGELTLSYGVYLFLIFFWTWFMILCKNQLYRFWLCEITLISGTVFELKNLPGKTACMYSAILKGVLKNTSKVKV